MGLAGIIGVAAGGVAWVLARLIGGLTNLALLHRLDWSIPSLNELEPSIWLPVVAVAGALAVTLMAKWAPAIRGHGIPEAMEAVLTRQSRVNLRTAVAKPVSIVVSIGTGAPFGAEGPIIVTGGGIGSILGQIVPVTPAERKILLGCGAAAGTAAIFGAPLAAVVLAIELLLFEFSARAILPIVVASSVAGWVHVALFGPRPLFGVEGHDFSGLGLLWVYALLGVACGLLAVVVCRGLFAVEAAYRRLPIGEFWHPMIGALGFALVGLVVPRALGTGYASIQDTLSSRLALGTLAVLFVAKLVAWWLALGSGTSGSTLAPILLIGGAFGAFFGGLVDALAPGLHVSPGAIALVAMSATFGAAIGANLTAIVFAFELTRDYEALLPLMLATVLAGLVASALLKHNLMTEKLSRQGVPVPKGYEPDALRHLRVREVMSTAVATLSIDDTIGVARRRVTAGSHHAYPLVDGDGRCVGIITRGDLLTDDVDDERPVGDVASRDLVTVSPDHSMLDVLERLVDENVDQVPVLDDGCLVGICTRTDILRARHRRLSEEEAQAGWRPPWRIRPSRPRSAGVADSTTETQA
jgi:H+/Cl- antiporter ClcA